VKRKVAEPFGLSFDENGEQSRKMALFSAEHFLDMEVQDDACGQRQHGHRA
jgi:hypothetical protein